MRRVVAALVLAWGPAWGQTTPPALHHMVAAADPRAVEAGLLMLREGGSAADAVVAVQMVLGLVEPQSSGIGGGAIALTYHKTGGQTLAWDGRETAPAAAGPDLFIGHDGKPMTRREAATGGRAVGVPGTLRMLEALHRAQGRLPWQRLIQPAILLADQGVIVSPLLSTTIARNAVDLARQPAARALLLQADGTALPAGAVLVNRALADTLRAIAAGGADAVLRGPVASDIATAVRADPSPGLITTDDLAAIRATSGPALCGPYRANMVCGPLPPSAGGVAVLQILGLLDRFNIAVLPEAGVDVAQILLEAERLETERSRPEPSAPADTPAPPALRQVERGATQICVVDDDGNAVSLTSTMEDAFGSKLLVHGFFLNDALIAFAFVPDIDGRPVANRVEGGKRPRSAMAPVLVFAADGSLRLVAGSAGGERIIGFMAQGLVRMLDFAMTPQLALAAGHAQLVAGVAELEADTAMAALAAALRARGQTVVVRAVASGQQAILVTEAGLVGAADPRGEGAALGD